MAAARPHAPRRLVWRLGVLIGFVSLAFVVGSFLRQRAESETHDEVRASEASIHTVAVQAAVRLRGLALRNFVADYSLWGDMAAFAEHGDPKWAETNVAAPLATFKLSHAWVFGREGHPRYHASTGAPLERLPGAERVLSAMLAQDAFAHYFARDADGELIEVQAARIQREDDAARTSQALGYFAAAIRWDEAYVAALGPLTGSEPAIVEPAQACPRADEEGSTIVVAEDLPGLDGPAARLCVSLPNQSAQLLAASSRLNYLTSLAFASALFLLLAVLLHVLVARPLAVIQEAIATGDVARLGDLEARRDEFGELARAVVSHERGAVERDRLRAQIYQSSKLASLGVLGAGMAHELNNPLAAVLGTADLLASARASGTLDDGELGEGLETVIAQAERMRAIIDHVRALSRGESGPPRLVAQDLNGIVEGAVMFVRRHVEHRGIALEVSLDRGLPPVACDEVVVHSVVHNLILNAADELETKASGQPRHIRLATALAPDGQVVLRVTDDGRGIPEDVRDRVFEPFFTTKPVGKGTGLGLAIVHGGVTQHGGSIRLETSERGTSFEVTLPAAADPPEPATHG